MMHNIVNPRRPVNYRISKYVIFESKNPEMIDSVYLYSGNIDKLTPISCYMSTHARINPFKTLHLNPILNTRRFCRQL